MYEKIIKQGKNARRGCQGGRGLLEKVTFGPGLEGGEECLAGREACLHTEGVAGAKARGRSVWRARRRPGGEQERRLVSGVPGRCRFSG